MEPEVFACWAMGLRWAGSCWRRSNLRVMVDSVLDQHKDSLIKVCRVGRRQGPSL